MCKAFCGEINMFARRIIIELHRRVAVGIGLDVGFPKDGAAEVLHRRHHRIVFHLESRRFVITLEMGSSYAFLIVIESFMHV